MTGASGNELVFIDTNIWVYAFTDVQDTVKTKQARALIQRERNIILNIQILNETTKICFRSLALLKILFKS